MNGPDEERYHRGQAEIVLPEWASRAHRPSPALCRSCGAEIAWVISRASGKRAPINYDGTSHFASCPQADAWRKQA